MLRAERCTKDGVSAWMEKLLVLKASKQRWSLKEMNVYQARKISIPTDSDFSAGTSQVKRPQNVFLGSSSANDQQGGGKNEKDQTHTGRQSVCSIQHGCRSHLMLVNRPHTASQCEPEGNFGKNSPSLQGTEMKHCCSEARPERVQDLTFVLLHTFKYTNVSPDIKHSQHTKYYGYGSLCRKGKMIYADAAVE